MRRWEARGKELRTLKRENEGLRGLFWMTLYYWMGPEFGPVPTDEEMYNKIASTYTLLADTQEQICEEEKMSVKEINAWCGGLWDCVCGEIGINGSFGCPSCELTIIGSNMERLRRGTQEKDDANTG
ncbi:MAG: hypothetical protein E3J60_00785 [Dehalococcoidia bacterium]|nr:MAG: hypothetical protein E3J60_00785 [Dehalococcoidia bacterium]